MLARRALLAVPALLLACSAFSGLTDSDPAPPPPASDAGSSDQAAPAVADGEAGDPGREDAPGPPKVVCDAGTKSETFAVKADGLIAVGSAQKFGTLSVCNLAVGRGLFRFTPSGAAMTALRGGTVTRMTLEVHKADKDANCDQGDCVKYRETGTLLVAPARVDWNEGEMTWSDRRTSTAWGADGAGAPGVDVGDLAAQVAVPATDTDVVVPLDPTKWVKPFADAADVAVRLEFFTDVPSSKRGQFVIVAREGGAQPANPAVLVMEYCSSK
jgi:hypothetical protein